MGWFWQSERGVREATEFRERFPSLQLHLDPRKRDADVTGVLPLDVGVAYTIRLLVAHGYPDEVPKLVCMSEEVPKLPARHNSGDTACLCARCDYRTHWPCGSSLTAFVDALVIPFLTCQHYFDVHGHWPKSGEREHGAPGIVQAYTEFCRPLGNSSAQTIIRTLRLLAHAGVPKGHISCPCGSGKRIRYCHRREFDRMRELISPSDASLDLTDLIQR